MCIAIVQPVIMDHNMKVKGHMQGVPSSKRNYSSVCGVHDGH